MEKKPKPVGPNTVYIHNMFGLLYVVKSFGGKSGSS